MKNFLGACALAVLALYGSQAGADEYVHGYYKGNGTYVQPYYRSSPDNTVIDNYSFKGNTNPYTGNVGNNYYRHSPSSPYYTGPYGR